MVGTHISAKTWRPTKIEADPKPRKIVANYTHYVGHVDLTIFPLGGGFERRG